MKLRLSLIALVVLSVAALWLYRQQLSQTPEISASILEFEGSSDNAELFERAITPREFVFPEDFGPHQDYQTEWWYYTGNVATVNGRRFGYQLTFFRRGLVPPALAESTEETSSFRATDAYMAHFALTDVQTVRHFQEERFQRGAAGVAGASGEPYEVWLDNWSVEEVGPDIYKLKAETSDPNISISFTLTGMKPPALNGDEGLSQKGDEAGNASYYYSQTRLETYGEIRLDGQRYTVTGFSWKDHEFGTTALPPDTVGWDWFSLQLAGGLEVMYYQFRKEDGTIGIHSLGTIVYPDGSTEKISLDEITLEVIKTWESPHTSATYPAMWEITIPKLSLDITVVPLISDQEMRNSTTYWEGAVEVIGTHEGFGYVEMTGYTGILPVF